MRMVLIFLDFCLSLWYAGDSKLHPQMKEEHL